jgi:hypothetical protein
LPKSEHTLHDMETKGFFAEWHNTRQEPALSLKCSVTLDFKGHHQVLLKFGDEYFHGRKYFGFPDNIGDHLYLKIFPSHEDNTVLSIPDHLLPSGSEDSETGCSIRNFGGTDYEQFIIQGDSRLWRHITVDIYGVHEDLVTFDSDECSRTDNTMLYFTLKRTEKASSRYGAETSKMKQQNETQKAPVCLPAVCFCPQRPSPSRREFPTPARDGSWSPFHQAGHYPRDSSARLNNEGGRGKHETLPRRSVSLHTSRDPLHFRLFVAKSNIV